jgi:hypothetical protein
MKEELTTLMHMEFCKDEDERLDIAAMSIDVEVFRNREIAFEDALKKYSITEKQFWKKSTLRDVLDFPNIPLSELKKKYFYMPDELYEEIKACKTKQEICYTYEKYTKYFDEMISQMERKMKSQMKAVEQEMGFMPDDSLHEKLKKCKTKQEICHTYEKYIEDSYEKIRQRKFNKPS